MLTGTKKKKKRRVLPSPLPLFFQKEEEKKEGQERATLVLTYIASFLLLFLFSPSVEHSNVLSFQSSILSSIHILRKVGE